jgi:hypothetical protein
MAHTGPRQPALPYLVRVVPYADSRSMPFEPRTEAFTVVTDELIARTIGGAERRAVVVAPAVSTLVAAAIADRMRALGPEAVTVILDSDPEVYRLGYGDLAGLEALVAAAHKAQAVIRRQPGLRIGVIIADHHTLIFVPTAKLVEAGPNTYGGTNAIALTTPSGSMESDLGLAGGLPHVGREWLTADHVADAQKDLTACPPQAFDLARQLRVFSAYIQFVELEVLGTNVGRRLIKVPSDLLGVADPATRQQLRAAFRLVSDDDDSGGDSFDVDRKLVADQFLHAIPKYGTVILLREKAAFVDEVHKLREAMDTFATGAKDRLKVRIERTIAQLVDALTPALLLEPPRRWVRSGGQKPDEAVVRRLLDRELRSAFGTADDLVEGMKVRVAFKGVTYDLLNDEDFRAAAAKAVPELGEKLHAEFDAAKGLGVTHKGE